MRAALAEAGDNERKLLNLRKRIARIRVFDPACGSGNFLVIAYKQMREIEAEINRRREEPHLGTGIPLTNFRGIELRDFPAEIARLALIIAEFQCDVLYRGQKDALADFLPLDAQNWIVCGNALRLDWLSICPPTGTGVKFVADDLFETPLDQAQIDFDNEGGETYICGNPPYKGGTEQNPAQKSDMEALFATEAANWKSLDYVSGWFLQFARYARHSNASCAFVSTNSITQGEQVARLWPVVLGTELRIHFAFLSFKWSNLASNNAGVTVVIVGLSYKSSAKASLYEETEENEIKRRDVDNINAYLVPYRDLVVDTRSSALALVPEMTYGNKPVDGGHLVLSPEEAHEFIQRDARSQPFIRQYLGAHDAIQGGLRYCIWIKDGESHAAMDIEAIRGRTALVAEMRRNSKKALTKAGAEKPYAFQQVRQRGDESVILIPSHSSESRPYLPVGLFPRGVVVSNAAFVIFDAELWTLSILVSRLHLVWIATVCGRIKADFRYSNTLGWNTFPVPVLTAQNKSDLTRSANDILLVREAHFPLTIADLYDPEAMPEDLRLAHERNDELLERIYIGRRFKNDTERLEKLFDLYTKMTAAERAKPVAKLAKARAKAS